ncbi:tectonin beta-propeller repeat-containing protein 1-like isoform X2 [Ptychodera flava]|uniref:tectonin beta-propeller repeat-containing protein 1-like isoform X2 n=1 Tax=Ptychodera flava TaxID=63121 RepID=UPI00396A2EC6
MSSTYLWGVDIFGNTYLLSNDGQYWEELKGQQLEMKRVSAVQRCAWGLGCDHQIYVYVHSTDVPIRLQVNTFENQRWNPVDGFTAKKLLFHDRWAWSNEDGTKQCPRSIFKLPSENWSWESDWCVDENIRGNPTGKGGWQYAVNFKRHYTADKKWNSCVRRRKWIRYKRYHAVDMWAKIFVRKGIHNKCPEGTHWQEVYTDDDREVTQISVGPKGSVWAVLWDGMVAVRNGYSHDHPIGTDWNYVSAPDNCVLSMVSVGTKAVWATTRDGRVWFRKGFNSLQANNDSFAALGVGWVEMVGNMSQVSVGPNDQVWALGFNEDKNVYFRTGVTPSEPSGKEWKAIECKEKDMTENFCSNSSASLASLLHSISMTEINELHQSEFTKGLIESISDGKLHPSSIHGNTGDDERDNASPDVATPDGDDDENDEPEEVRKKVQFFTSPEDVNEIDATHEITKSRTRSMHKPYWQSSFTAFAKDDSTTQKENTVAKETLSSGDGCNVQECTQQIERNPSQSEAMQNENINSPLETNDGKDTDQDSNEFVESTESFDHCESLTSESSDVSDTIIDFVNDYDGSQEVKLHTGMGSVSFRNSRSSGPIEVAREALVRSRYSMNLGSKSSNQKGDNAAMEPAKSAEHYACIDSFHHSLSELCKHYSNGEIVWVCVSGGGCYVEPMMALNWFTEPKTSRQQVKGKTLSSVYRKKIAKGEWREKIVKQLEERQKEEVENFSQYEHAIQRTSWVKKGRMVWWSEHRPHKWYDCHVELEQGGIKLLDESTFTVYYSHYGRQKHVQLPLSSVTCVQHVTCPGQRKNKPTFALITAERTTKRKPLRVAANSYEEMEDWISAIAMRCRDLQGLCRAPSNQAVWSTTVHGDIFYHEPLPVVDTMPCNQMYWHQIGGHLLVTETCPAGVVWGLGHDNTVWIYTGGYGGGPFKGIVSSTRGIHKQTDHKELAMYQTQRWNPIHGFTDRGLIRHMFHRNEDTSSLQDNSQQVQLPSPHWQWVDEWSVDYTLEGGTDKEGWQYANDFPGWYHKDKKWKDYVRRRRLVRKCKTTILGPWLELPPLSLLDVSLQVDAKEQGDDPIALWAIASNGDVVTREGVTRSCPAGTNWLHIPSDQPFQSISVGGNYRVWGIAKDGSAYLRNSVNPSNVAGDCWFHVPPPHVSLRQVSVGMAAVYAVDTNNGLWYRKDITLTFPEGTRWIHVCNNVYKVSVGPKDQVWILAEKVGGSRQVVCKRKGITSNKPTGVSWDLGIGGGWTHICVRGCTRSCDDNAELEDESLSSSQKSLSDEPRSSLQTLSDTPLSSLQKSLSEITSSVGSNTSSNQSPS